MEKQIELVKLGNSRCALPIFFEDCNIGGLLQKSHLYNGEHGLVLTTKEVTAEFIRQLYLYRFTEADEIIAAVRIVEGNWKFRGNGLMSLGDAGGCITYLRSLSDNVKKIPFYDERLSLYDVEKLLYNSKISDYPKDNLFYFEAKNKLGNLTDSTQFKYDFFAGRFFQYSGQEGKYPKTEYEVGSVKFFKAVREFVSYNGKKEDFLLSLIEIPEN